MAGDGNYGGNGSVYWKNNHGGSTISGTDPTPVNQIGNNSGTFRLKLRYSTSSQKPAKDLIGYLNALIDDATKAIDKLRAGQDDVTVEARVPAIPRTTPPTNDHEVKIDW